MPLVPAPPDPSAPPLLVIAGPTASGKSRLGLEVAQLLDGEIVSADAFAVYRGLDIGTDTPDTFTRTLVPHHLIDVVEPDRRFSAGEFTTLALGAIAAIRDRGKVPIVVGGTHFWIRALLVELAPLPPSEPSIRRALDADWDHDPEQVANRLERIDPASAGRIGRRDRQRVLRALEVFALTGRRFSDLVDNHHPFMRFRPLVTAPRRDKDDLYVRISARVDRMFAAGLVDEVARLRAGGVPANAHALKAIGYREVVRYQNGQLALDAAITATKKASRTLAKRQLTWLRSMREAHVEWVAPPERRGAHEVVQRWARHSEGIEVP